MSDGRRDRDAYAPAYAGTLNNATADAYARAPRLRVLVTQTDGTKPEIPGAETASVTVNNWYQSDAFNLTFALSADPRYGAHWWAAQTDMLLDIQVGFETNGAVAWKSLLIGTTDTLELHLSTGLVTVSGRDLTARFIEAKTQATYANQTASEIVTALALSHGMNADVTKTTTLAGEYWAQDHAAITLNQFQRQTTEWDLMTSLARFEGFDLYVQGTTVFFHPATDPASTPWVVQWVAPTVQNGASFGQKSNAIDLRMHRALTLAKDIQVDVRSWHSKTGRGFTKTAKSLGVKSANASPINRVQRYSYIVPNLTEDQALKYAQAKLAEISQHERVISWVEPGDMNLTPRALVRLQGTNTDFDQTYFVDSIEHRIAFGEGYTMHPRAKNKDARSQATIL